jgi:hypothetical protein
VAINVMPNTIRIRLPYGMYMPADVIFDGVDWYQPIQQPKPNNARARKKVKLQKTIAARYADYNENQAYARKLLDREIILTAAAAKGKSKT